MTNPVLMIVTGVVIAAAAIIAVLATNSPQTHSYGRRRDEPRQYRYSPPPSPIPRPRVRRRRSPIRTSQSSQQTDGFSNEMQTNSCSGCGESPYVKIHPCEHQSLCKNCFLNHLKTKNACPTCDGRIDSCSPSIPSYGKCKKCSNFTQLFKFRPCSHSLSLCFSCFEESGEVYNECPECKGPIAGYEPNSSTSGLCKVCDCFTRFAVFQPCGHRNFCKKHAVQYLRSEEECIDCRERVTRID